MTKHASLHARTYFPTESRQKSSSRSRSRCVQDHHRHYTNTMSSSNSSQGVAATYCSIDGPGPPSQFGCCLANADANLTRFYTQQLPPPPPSNRTEISAGERRIPSNIYTRHHRPLHHSVATRSFNSNGNTNAKYPTTALAGNYASLPPGFSNANYTNAVNVYQDVFPTTTENVLTFVESSNRSSDRPVSPVSITTTDGVVDPCGGHCRTCEKFCHYFLLTSFVIGIVVGVCLVLAGYILHGQKRGEDLLVLVYIGALTAIVCTLLLSIQCNVRRDAKRRKRRRAYMMTAARSRMPISGVPLRDLRTSMGRVYQDDVQTTGDNATSATSIVYHHPRHAVIDSAIADTNLDMQSSCEMPLMHSGVAIPKSQIRSYDEMSQSQNGIPWWRRDDAQVTFKYGNIV